MRASSKVLVALVALGCGSDADCILAPCAPPIAITIAIKSATGLALPGTVTETDAAGTVLRTTDCPMTGCAIGQQPGTYHLVISVPSFQSKQMTVSVTGHDGGKCSCPTVDTQHFDVGGVF